MKDGTIAVTSADKGGVIIAVTPDIIKEITASKVNDLSRYKNLGPEDPTQGLRKRLMSLWCTGWVSDYVPAEQLKTVVGLIPKKDGS